MNVFTHVTVQTLKKNKTRTLVTIIGILLATAMLTAVTTIVSSLQNFMIEAVIASEGDWHGAVYQLSRKEKQEIEGAEEVEKAGAYQEVGYASLSKDDKDRKPYIFVAGMEEGLNEIMPVEVKEGRMPQTSQELAVSKELLTRGQFSVKIGDTLTLDLGERYLDGQRLDNGAPLTLREDEKTLAEELVYRKSRTYTVVGLIEPPIFEEYNSPAYFALTLADEEPSAEDTFVCYYKMKKASQVYDFTEAHKNGHTKQFNSELLRYQGISKNRPFMQMLYGLACILILLIMAGGISLVYNSFAISVSDRTRQFGLLASIGATPRQMRGMVLKEAIIVSGVGIPLGILSGILGIGIALQVTGKSFVYLYQSQNPLRLHVSVPAVGIAAVTALLTVLFSAWLPALRAAKVSPMDAIRQTRDIQVSKKIVKRGKWAYRLFGLPGMIAGKHFSRSKKQYRATIFSLFISIVLFISASSFSAYVRSSITTVNDVPDYDLCVYVDEGKKEFDQIKEKLRQMESVQEMMAAEELYVELELDHGLLNEEYRNLIEAEDREEEQKLGASVIILEDDTYISYLEESGLSAEEYMDPQNMQAVVINQIRGYVPKEQKYRIFQVLDQGHCTVKMILTNYTARDEAYRALEEPDAELGDEQFQITKEISIGALTDRGPMNLYAERGGAFAVILPESMFAAMVEQPEDYVMTQVVYLKTPAHQAIAKTTEEWNYTEGWEANIFTYDFTENLQSQKSMLFTVDVFTYGFIVLISLIAAANVFNTISTGFLLRRREFAVLSSVGMAPKEMLRMLQFECLMYGSKALLYGIPVSLLVTVQIYKVVSDSMDTGFFIPIESVLIAVCSVFAVVFATMLYARNKLRRENLMDSIRRESV